MPIGNYLTGRRNPDDSQESHDRHCQSRSWRVTNLRDDSWSTRLTLSVVMTRLSSMSRDAYFKNNEESQYLWQYFKNNEGSQYLWQRRRMTWIPITQIRPSPTRIDQSRQVVTTRGWYSGDRSSIPTMHPNFVRGCIVAFARPRDTTVKSWEKSWESERGICYNKSIIYNHTLIYILFVSLPFTLWL